MPARPGIPLGTRNAHGIGMAGSNCPAMTCGETLARAITRRDGVSPAAGRPQLSGGSITPPTKLSIVETRIAPNPATILPASLLTSGGTASAQTMKAIVEAISFHHGHCVTGCGKDRQLQASPLAEIDQDEEQRRERHEAPIQPEGRDFREGCRDARHRGRRGDVQRDGFGRDIFHQAVERGRGRRLLDRAFRRHRLHGRPQIGAAPAFSPRLAITGLRRASITGAKFNVLRSVLRISSSASAAMLMVSL